MAWLVREGGDVLASAEVARRARERTVGLLGRDRDAMTGVLVIRPCRQVHTFGMRFPITAVLLDTGRRVLDVRRIEPGRHLLPRLRVRYVLECGEDAPFRPGDVLRWA